MMQRVNITVKKAGEQHDLNVPLAATPVDIAAALGWKWGDSVVVTNRNTRINRVDSLAGKIREGDLLIFEQEESAGWQS